MQNEKKSTFFGGAAILMVGVIIVKIIGAVYKIPLMNILGDVGYGHFSAAYTVFNVLLTIATAGLPVALSQAIAQGEKLYVGQGDAYVAATLEKLPEKEKEVIDPYSYFEYKPQATGTYEAAGATFYTLDEATKEYKEEEITTLADLQVDLTEENLQLIADNASLTELVREPYEITNQMLKNIVKTADAIGRYYKEL